MPDQSGPNALQPFGGRPTIHYLQETGAAQKNAEQDYFRNARLLSGARLRATERRQPLDGKEIFYSNPSGQMMATDVSTNKDELAIGGTTGPSFGGMRAQKRVSGEQREKLFRLRPQASGLQSPGILLCLLRETELPARHQPGSFSHCSIGPER